MAKKGKLAKFKAKRKNPETLPKSSEMELAVNIGAGFAGYAAVRFFARMVFSQVIKKYPHIAQHTGAAASLIAAVAAYFTSKHWKKLSPQHEAIAIGAGIALLQSVITTYVPKLGWVVSDYKAEEYTSKSALPITGGAEATSDFDLDALLASDSDLEAVPLMAPHIEEQGLGDFSDAHLDDAPQFDNVVALRPA